MRRTITAPFADLSPQQVSQLIASMVKKGDMHALRTRCSRRSCKKRGRFDCQSEAGITLAIAMLVAPGSVAGPAVASHAG
jgi:hypothetical protein